MTTQQHVTPAELRQLASDLSAWARRVLGQLDVLESQSEGAQRSVTGLLTRRVFPLRAQPGSQSSLNGCVAVLLPSGKEGQPLREALAQHGDVLQIGVPLLLHVPALRAALARALDDLRPASGGLLSSRSRAKYISPAAVDRLRELADWGEKTGYTSALQAAAQSRSPITADEHVLDMAVARAADTVVPQGGCAVPGAEVRLLLSVVERAEKLSRVREEIEATVASAYEAIRDRMVARRLAEVPVTAIREASTDTVRIAPLERAGITTVQAVLDRGVSLAHLPGVSEATALQIRSTASHLWRLMRDDLKLRIDLDEKDPLLSTLVVALHTILDVEDRLDGHQAVLEELTELLRPLRSLAPDGDDDLVLLHRSSPRRGGDLARHLLSHAEWVRQSGLDEVLGDVRSDPARAAQSWQAFKKHSIRFYGLLSEIVGVTVDAEAAQGHLPQEVVDAVNQQALDTTRLKASLRGYQAFGARYALVQRHVIIGDEMGLGKTVQALAAMAHLAANGARHFLVVCPPAVLLNWMKEVQRHTDLRPVRVHGPDRDAAWRRWTSQGGVAITSYGLLGKLPLATNVDLLVVDEAHMVKNPSTQRAVAVSSVADRSARTTFLTGTPLENRVEEFRNLIGYLQPEVAKRLDSAAMVLGARTFREAVAPVYLRRNSDDVLAELPERVDVEEWVELTRAERHAYVDALHDRQFMTLRQVAFTADPLGPSKLDRLEELVEEAMANGRKVVVFSYFLEVLSAIALRLGAHVAGTITGAISADGRQAIVDKFTEQSSPGVLLSQMVAGGVGINLQAASVVILCEPQVKPTLEDQAVKRAHRMGQVHTVQVHRLLTPESVDERLLAILAEKRRTFAEYAAQSEVAEASPEAVDMTDSAVAKRVLEDETRRYAAELRARQGNASAPDTRASRSASPPTLPLVTTQVERSPAPVEPPRSTLSRPHPVESRTESSAFTKTPRARTGDSAPSVMCRVCAVKPAAKYGRCDWCLNPHEE